MPGTIQPPGSDLEVPLPPVEPGGAGWCTHPVGGGAGAAGLVPGRCRPALCAPLAALAPPAPAQACPVVPAGCGCSFSSRGVAPSGAADRRRSCRLPPLAAGSWAADPACPLRSCRKEAARSPLLAALILSLAPPPVSLLLPRRRRLVDPLRSPPWLISCFPFALSSLVARDPHPGPGWSLPYAVKIVVRKVFCPFRGVAGSLSGCGPGAAPAGLARSPLVFPVGRVGLGCCRCRRSRPGCVVRCLCGCPAGCAGVVLGFPGCRLCRCGPGLVRCASCAVCPGRCFPGCGCRSLGGLLCCFRCGFGCLSPGVVARPGSGGRCLSRFLRLSGGLFGFPGCLCCRCPVAGCGPLCLSALFCSVRGSRPFPLSSFPVSIVHLFSVFVKPSALVFPGFAGFLPSLFCPQIGRRIGSWGIVHPLRMRTA